MIINFFSQEIINNVNIFNINMKLNVFYENNNILIIFKNNIILKT